MTKYIENVNAYLSQMKIKQNYLCMKTGIDSKKMSRILNGVQDITSTDMEKIADALGKDTAFFWADQIYVPQINELGPEKIAFYAGNPTSEQEKTAKNLFDLMENIDTVLSANGRFLNFSK